MASNFKRADAAVNEEATRVGALANSGKLRIYSGTQPANADAAITGTLLAELTMNASAFGSPTAGLVTAAAITQDSGADADGTATHFRLWKSDGTTPIFDGNVGTSGCDLNLNSVSIQAGGVVAVSSFTYQATK